MIQITFLEDRSYLQWYILDIQGNLVAKFKWSSNSMFYMVKNNKAYTVENTKSKNNLTVSIYDISWQN